MVAPGDAVSVPERVGDELNVLDRGGGGLESAREEHRVVFVGQGESLLLGEPELAGVGVVFGVPGGGLSCQPFGHVPLVRFRPFSQVRRSDPLAVRHCLVEAESIPDQQGGGVHHRSEILYEAAEELLQLVVVEVRD